MIISFFGHSMALPYDKYEDKVMELLEDVSKGQHVDFYLGGYGNFDAFGLQCARQFKKKHPDTKILLVCLEQTITSICSPLAISILSIAV